MSASLSTFNTTTEHLEKTETTTAVAPPPPSETPIAAPAVATPPPTIPTPAATEAPPPAAESTEPDLSSTSFALDDGSEAQIDTPATVQQYNFDDELKKVDPKELLKKLGISDFAIEMDTYTKSGGQAIDYLNNRAIDFTKISDDRLIKDDLRNQYPTLTPSQIDILYNKRYAVDETSSDEDKEFVQAQLQGDAYKIRQNKIAEQQKFKIPDTPIPQKDEVYEAWKQNTAQQAALTEEIKNFYVNHPATKALNESKKVALNLGENVPAFNFVIDKPEMLTKAFTDDGTTWRKLTSNNQGEPDVAKQQLIALFSYNPQKFIQDLFNYGSQMGERKLIKEGQNAQKPQAIVTNMPSSAKPTVTGTGTYGNKQRD